MKRTIYFFLASAGLVLLLILANALTGMDKQTRIHQHKVYHKRVKTDPVREFNTHLPIISIDLSGNVLPDYHSNETILTRVSLYQTEEDRNNYLTDEPTAESLCRFRIRGHSSRRFDKKSYLMEFTDEAGENVELPLCGMEPHHEWVLHGPFLDKSLIRNYMWYNIAGEIMDYAPNVRFAEVFIDGEYQGLYVVADSISAAPSRIDITKSDPEDYMTGYIMRLDRGSINELKNLNTFSKYTQLITSTTIADIIYPKNDEAILRQKPYIEKDISDFERMLYSYDFKDYPEYIDVDSFVDYFIINEFTQNYDAGKYSTYLYKDLRGRYSLCVWDFNNACDNYIEWSTKNADFDMPNTLWFDMLTRDPAFIDRVIDRYRILRKGVLSENYLMQYVDDTVAFLGDAVDRNFSVWGYTFEPSEDLLEKDRRIGSYKAAVRQLKDFIRDRGDYLDRSIEDLRQFSHESVNKQYLP